MSNQAWDRFCREIDRSGNFPGVTGYIKKVPEFGEIEEFITKFTRGNRWQQLRDSVDLLRRGRNTLAHYVPLEWDGFLTVVREMAAQRRFC